MSSHIPLDTIEETPQPENRPSQRRPSWIKVRQIHDTNDNYHFLKG
jgi:hypothetical protein